MGASSSIIHQKQLFHQITDCLEESRIKTEEEGEEENNNHLPTKTTATTTTTTYQDIELFDKINGLYQKWFYETKIEESLLRIPLIQFEVPFNQIFTNNHTPFLIDESSDEKIMTYFSYQHTSILDGKKLVTDYLIKKISLLDCLDYCRRALVNAMKHGKLLVINLGNSAPDFQNIFNDDYLVMKMKEKSNPIQSQSQKGKGDENQVDLTEIAYFPLDVFLEGGRNLKSNEWVKKLYREEDMLPHKNFAICRDEFRVCLVSKCTPPDVYEYYFGGFPQFLADLKREANPHLKKAPLPHRSNFELLYINPVDNEQSDGDKSPRK